MTAEIRLRSAIPQDAKWLEELMNRNWGGLPRHRDANLR